MGDVPVEDREAPEGEDLSENPVEAEGATNR